MKLTKKTKKKIIKIADDLINFNYLVGLSNLVYGWIFSILFSLFFIGVRLKLVEGIFQYLVFMFLAVFCFGEANKHFSKLQGLWLIVGMGIFINYILAGFGHHTVILQSMIKFAIFIVIINIIYILGFRRYLIKKWLKN